MTILRIPLPPYCEVCRYHHVGECNPLHVRYAQRTSGLRKSHPYTECVEQLLKERDVDDRNTRGSESPCAALSAVPGPAVVLDFPGQGSALLNDTPAGVEPIPGVRDWW